MVFLETPVERCIASTESPSAIAAITELTTSFGNLPGILKVY